MNRGLIATVIGVGVAVALGLVFYFDRKEDTVEATVVPSVAAPSESTASESTASERVSAFDEAVAKEAAPLETGAGETGAGETAETDVSKDDAASVSASDSTPETKTDAVQLAALQSSGDTASEDMAAGDENETSSAAILPSFDVVRVEQSGEGVIAGRAEPGCLVIVFDGTIEIGRVRADAAGNWVLILASALAPGTHELRIVARLDSGQELHAEQAAIIALKGPESIEAIKEAQNHGLAGAVEEMKGPPPVSATAASLPTDSADGTLVASAEPQSSGMTNDAADAKPLVVLVPDEAGKASQVLPSRVVQGGPDLKGEGIADKDLVLNSIDYNESGKALVAGRGEPGSNVVVYLDNQPLAAAKVDDEGNWPAVLDKPIKPGLHSLRVDQVDDSGAVLARVETPFSRADLGADAFVEGAVVVQPGNSLWRISRRVYGEGVRYSVIYQTNSDKIADPDLIYPGQIFNIPKLQ